MKMKDAMKIAEQWAIDLIGGKRGPGVNTANLVDAINANLRKNDGLRKALQKVDWCK
jgi:hypothetical protein